MIHCPLGSKRNYQNYFNQKQIIYTVCDETLELSSNCTQISKKYKELTSPIYHLKVTEVCV